MLKVSMFTPTHNPDFLLELYETVKDQDFYEWVIVANGERLNSMREEGEKLGPFSIFPGSHLDSRIRLHWYTGVPYVGALKRYACSKCTGDILMEVDHDDLLMSDTVFEVQKAFESDPEVGFVYSNDANFEGDFKDRDRYNLSMGWQYRDLDYKGHKLSECISFQPHPMHCSKIWFAPDHVRCWRKDVYWETGGHNEGMRVLDDQDLISRTFMITKFKHIDKCLYLYRVTGSNTWLEHNKEIQDNVIPIYHRYIQGMSLSWAKREGLLALDLGGRFDRKEGFASVDLKDADYIADLNERWPWEDNSVGVIVANDIIEHLKDPLHTMKEAYRVLCHGGILLIQVPSTDGRGAYQDPSHISFWNENSFWYYTRYDQSRYIDTPVRFQSSVLETFHPTDWHRDNRILYVRAHLTANKNSNIRIAGPIEI